VLAHNYIDHNVPKLLETDTVADALAIFEQDKYDTLPLLSDQQVLLGLIEETHLFNFDMQLLLSKVEIKEPIYVKHEEHILNALKVWMSYSATTTICPILDNNEKYLGCLTPVTALQYFSKQHVLIENGGILVLKIAIQDYSLVEIAKLVEANNANILGVEISTLDKYLILVTLRINKADLKDIQQTFLRYNYNVVATFHQSNYEKGLQERFESLMMYLNI
jgi:acetoin utilization protein AcuB